MAPVQGDAPVNWLQRRHTLGLILSASEGGIYGRYGLGVAF